VSRKPMADVLGEVYEQFLGKVIRLTAGHQAKVEEKPEGAAPARAFDLRGPILHNVRMEIEPHPALTRAGETVGTLDSQ
jgi:hypothetical protein